VFEPSEIKVIACPDESTFYSWLAGIRLAIHGPKLKDGYDETLRKFDALVQMGASKPETTESLVNKDLSRQNVVQANKHLIRQWQAQRAAADTPGFSAATGVEFADMGEEEGATDELGIPPELRGCSWFHGNIARQEAEALFARMNYITGCFLVRASTSHPGDFVLSVCVGGQPHHYHVREVCGKGGRGQPFLNLCPCRRHILTPLSLSSLPSPVYSLTVTMGKNGWALTTLRSSTTCLSLWRATSTTLAGCRRRSLPRSRDSAPW
jgi:hypothetical protein